MGGQRPTYQSGAPARSGSLSKRGDGDVLVVYVDRKRCEKNHLETPSEGLPPRTNGAGWPP